MKSNGHNTKKHGVRGKTTPPTPWVREWTAHYWAHMMATVQFFIGPLFGPCVWSWTSVYGANGQNTMTLHYVTLIAGLDNSAGLRMEKIGPVVSEVCILQSLAPVARPERCVNENFSLKPFDDFSAKAWHYNQSGVDIGVTDAFVPVTWRWRRPVDAYRGVPTLWDLDINCFGGW